MRERLVRTREGLRYLEELTRRESEEDLDKEDYEDLHILAWAGSKSSAVRSSISRRGRKDYPLIPERLKRPESRRAARGLFEAGYLEYAEA